MRPPLPVVIYDGRCGFCARWVGRWKARTGRAVLYVPLQLPFVPLLLGVRKRRARKAIQLVEPSGRRSEGARAVFRLLSRTPGRRVVARLGLLPGVVQVAQLAYGQVARHRKAAAFFDRQLFGRSSEPPRAASVRGLFSRALGGVYLLAFTSLAVQLRGLYGSRGIRPVPELMERLREDDTRAAWAELPTIFWWRSSDRALVNTVRAGQLASVALLLDVWPRLASFVAWALYGSFVTVGREFLGYQWDALLLETGAHAIAVSRPGILPRRTQPEPSRFAVWLMRFFVLRFYLESGLAKWRSGDPTWRQFTACRHYYETAPLPTRLGWYAHHLPLKAQKASTLAALGIEIYAPLLGLGPRRVRGLAVLLFELLQATIFATGNYGFFNVLSAILPLWLLDDAQLPAHLRASREKPRRRPLSAVFEGSLGLLMFALGALELSRRVGFLDRRSLPERVREVEGRLLPWRLVSGYGLFAVMTTERFEITVEGSDDGVTWREYVFRWKPSATQRAPRLNAPHQPRLDWQMWFAALSPAVPSWFVSFAGRLLEGSPDVLRLLESNPFPQHPPRYLRAVLHRYRMTDLATRRREGTWWKREPAGLFLPPVSLEKAEESARPQSARF